VDDRFEAVNEVRSLISAQHSRKTPLQTCRSPPEAASAVLRWPERSGR
jgi:hypothetical protein